MNTFKATSHFIAIPVSGLDELFANLRKYIESNNLCSDITLNNSSTTHITLDYLDKEIDHNHVKSIINKSLQFLDGITISCCGIGSFNNKIVFLDIISEQLADANKFFISKITSEASERDLPFKPHITLFTIKNPCIYKKHHHRIHKIISDSSYTLHLHRVSLYSADSTLESELQTLIYQVSPS